MARTGDPVYAADKAGYGSPDVRGYELAHKPDLQAETHRRRMMRLANLVDPATSLLETVVTSPDKSILWTHRIAAATFLVKRYDEMQKVDGGGKDPSQMTREEIEATIQALRVLQSESAKVIEAEPAEQVSTPDPTSVFD